jgi:hypothetical protein
LEDTTLDVLLALEVVDEVEVLAELEAGDALGAAVAWLAPDGRVVKELVVVDVVLLPLPDPPDEPVTVVDVVELPAPVSLEVAVVLVVALVLNARAWFVEPVTFEYFWVTVPEGEVAPSKTVLEPVSKRSAIDAGVCTSPRTSRVVSRFPR